MISSDEDKVAGIINALDFDRKRPMASAQKDAYSRMQKDVNDVRLRVNKLHLRLWHAVNQHDYHSLSLEETREALQDIAKHIEAIASKN